MRQPSSKGDFASLKTVFNSLALISIG